MLNGRLFSTGWRTGWLNRYKSKLVTGEERGLGLEASGGGCCKSTSRQGCGKGQISLSLCENKYSLEEIREK